MRGHGRGCWEAATTQAAWSLQKLRGRKDPPQSLQGERGPAHTLILDSALQGWGYNLCCSRPRVQTCTGQPRTLVRGNQRG